MGPSETDRVIRIAFGCSSCAREELRIIVMTSAAVQDKPFKTNPNAPAAPVYTVDPFCLIVITTWLGTIGPPPVPVPAPPPAPCVAVGTTFGRVSVPWKVYTSVVGIVMVCVARLVTDVD
jgi:hypothetical protein